MNARLCFRGAGRDPWPKKITRELGYVGQTSRCLLTRIGAGPNRRRLPMCVEERDAL